MSGVNSINWTRIVVQIIYYFFSYFKIAEVGEKINFSVPTGNFGDIYAGYIAKKMGLPINKLVIATNKNDILKRAVNTGFYKPKQVEHTISPSMDIQIASNFERLIFDICDCDANKTLKLMNDLSKNGEFKFEKEPWREYAEAVREEYRNYIRSAPDEVFEKESFFGPFGNWPLLAHYATLGIYHISTHQGEIAALIGLEDGRGQVL